jgi:N-acetylglutamate synthase-like GNAT family acetyltransferase
MRVREAGPKDFLLLRRLARSLNLDYPGMENDRLWVAEEGGAIVGLVALKTHPDCLELCALGVDPAHRRKGLAKALVEALMAEAGAEVHLATVIPAFFEARGFSVTEAVPEAFAAKRRTDWCKGCDVKSCRVMIGRTT